MQNIHISPLAIILTVIANFIFGFLWYTPLFGKVWGREMGFKMDQKPPASALIKGMIFMIIGNFLMAFVFAHNIAAWNPLTWGQPASPVSPVVNATMAAFFTWIGFFVPSDLSTVAWEGKSWTLFFINTFYHFISLLIAAMILTYMC
jgi:hypothetical protein